MLFGGGRMGWFSWPLCCVFVCQGYCKAVACGIVYCTSVDAGV